MSCPGDAITDMAGPAWAAGNGVAPEIAAAQPAALGEELQPVLLGVIGEALQPALPAAEQIGFKAHNLARMAALGLQVPAGFVLPAAWCSRGDKLRPAHWQWALAAVERASGLTFGDVRRPLLVSVRSGAAQSMPGMLDTLLNIGLCEATLPGLLRASGNPRLVWDAYRRLLAGFGETVMGVPAQVFDADLAAVTRSVGQPEHALDFTGLRQLAQAHRASIERHAGRPFPQDPWAQLSQSIDAVFRSWGSERAVAWRRLHGIDDAAGTSVTVQRMVFGNSGGTSGAGVGFTRHPLTGAHEPWIDFLFNAQGEDVVSGRHDAHGHETLSRVAPEVWRSLMQACRQLEAAFQDMQDIEFTVESGVLWLLQTRPGKRTPLAAVRIALDMVAEGLISTDTARRRTAGLDAQALTVERVMTEEGDRAILLAEAVCASQGVASGEIVFDETMARQRVAAGAQVLLLRPNADTRDLAALELSEGLLTTQGARTAHAAVVARQLGKVCLVGCSAMVIDSPRRQVHIGETLLHEGDVLTLDGNDGCIYAGCVHRQPQVNAELLSRLATLRGEG